MKASTFSQVVDEINNPTIKTKKDTFKYDPKHKTAYEWVLVFFNENNEDMVLTEKQYEYYIENHASNFVSFAEFGVNPSAICNTYKRPAQVIKDKYPCLKCNTNGYLIHGSTELETCPECEGTGCNL